MSDWNEIKRLLLDGTPHEVKTLRCPEDGSSLKVEVVTRDQISLGVTCVSCQSGVRMDGLEQVPDWVKELGVRFETD